MRNGKRSAKIEGIFDVNMTPLIDVSLVLVVILMVATPLAFQSSIAVKTAAASGKAAKLSSRAEWIEVSILGEDSVRVNRVVVRRTALEAEIAPLVAESPTRQVVVRCDDRVSHGTFVAVLDAARRAGAVRLAVMGR
ncbi:MAG TPA: biopolymer transporter ExbD [Candidatus Eisenbacteria bacterium]|nr:biopolymer transporter ExbD [Candidatus Eisenbacteria bacterium]